ncbi:hypothetical protein AVEN_49369-1 [Araneus ventricosus]|uniref:Uncharacterized protein n=1 Tax=Araneus ventricosus TaxID=182803 RepID=A0A4Y2LPR6_ARAVE|nr:hypothetical protein AVEN_49369-1 [Araneus ventricosus]
MYLSCADEIRAPAGYCCTAPKPAEKGRDRITRSGRLPKMDNCQRINHSFRRLALDPHKGFLLYHLMLPLYDADADPAQVS